MKELDSKVDTTPHKLHVEARRRRSYRWVFCPYRSDKLGYFARVFIVVYQNPFTTHNANLLKRTPVLHHPTAQETEGL
ncbi:hypothetical protein MW695_10085 [Alkalihalobacillus sp. APA_J-10(15)]|nr:hypothetical protein [Halalkalibacter sp. APA_J-10(15)]